MTPRPVYRFGRRPGGTPATAEDGGNQVPNYITDQWKRGQIYDPLEHMPLRFFALDPAKVQAVTVSNDAFVDVIYHQKPDLDIDTTWDAIDYLVQRAEGVRHWETQPLLHDGDVPDDAGIHDSRVRDAAATRDLAQRLSARSRDEIAELFDVAELDKRQIYPERWRERAGDGRTRVLDAFAATRDFVQRTAAAGRGLMTLLE